MSVQASQAKGKGWVMVKRFPNRLDNFQLMKWDGPGTKLEAVEPTDPDFSIMVAAVHFALRLLETKGGQAALRKEGYRMCDGWAANNEFPDTTANPTVIKQDMARLVNYFLFRLRSGFCNLVLTDHVDNANAAFMRPKSDHGKDYTYTGMKSFDPNNWAPKHRGVMLCNNGPGELLPIIRVARKTAIQREGDISKNAHRQFKEMLMALGILLVHEVGHTFTLFLAQLHGSTGRALTPRNVFCDPATGGQGDTTSQRTKGEAGYALQYYAFGGHPSTTFTTPEEDIDLIDRFLWSRLTVRTFIKRTGTSKDRHIPVKLLNKFFKASKTFKLKDLQGPGTKLLDPIEPKTEDENEEEEGEEEGEEEEVEEKDDDEEEEEEAKDEEEEDEEEVKDEEGEVGEEGIEGFEKGPALLREMFSDSQEEIADALRTAPMSLIRHASDIEAFVMDPSKLIPAERISK